MSHNGLPPPSPACLWRPYSSNPNRKGGTLIVADVGDRETHERRRCDPDGYRPVTCPACAHGKLHVHDYPERKVLLLVLVRYLCPACGATWRMLPLFAAPLLWRSWAVVEAETLGPRPPPAAPRVPERTACRWRARLRTAAVLLLGVLREHGDATVAAVAAAVGEVGTRLQLVVAHAAAVGVQIAQRLARLAALMHALVPGVRLM